ncbi:MAG: hypothetical protein CM15mP46_0830 [Alphaproteobacteria bacterium]|nr:MAG: hypothetical protein CM15mP46_0830 [Alphaproteobacteria bacterium]
MKSKMNMTRPQRRGFEIKDDGTAIADARLEVEDLEAVVGNLLDDDERDEVDTVGGWCLRWLDGSQAVVKWCATGWAYSSKFLTGTRAE